MKVFTNKRKVQAHYFLSTTLTMTGLSLLAGAFFILFTNTNVLASTLTMALGALSATTGTRLTNRWIRRPTPADAINTALKGMGHSASLYHHFPPAAHLLICDHGTFALTAIHTDINLNIDGNTWEDTANLPHITRRLLLYGRLGNPLQQAATEAQRATQWLRKTLGRNSIQVQPIVTFTHPSSAFIVQSQPSIPVTHTSKTRYTLKATVRQFSNLPLTEPDIDIINRTLKLNA